MNSAQLLFNMWKEKDNFNPPLSIKEILDFYDTEIPEEKRIWSGHIDPKKLKASFSSVDNYKGLTKKSIKEKVKQINIEIKMWMDRNREKKTVWNDIHIEDLVEEKEKLDKRLKYAGQKFDNNDLIRAKECPISDFIDFKMGFAKCLWHNEKTPSLKYYPNKNKVHCFAGCGSKDAIDVVMQLNNCDLKGAIKIILG